MLHFLSFEAQESTLLEAFIFDGIIAGVYDQLKSSFHVVSSL